MSNRNNVLLKKMKFSHKIHHSAVQTAHQTECIIFITYTH